MTLKTLTIKENILGANRENAEETRKLLDARKVRMINVMSASGSGKTSLIVRTIERLRGTYRVAVIQGNIGSAMDTARFTALGIPAAEVNTTGGCHLDARMIQKALDTLDLHSIDLILIENIGNLVCTADFDLGAHWNAVILSVPEGDDKPYKYPVLFVEADVVLVNKIDVLPWFDFKLDTFPETIGSLNPAARVFPVSAKTGEGMECWFSWIEERLKD